MAKISNIPKVGEFVVLHHTTNGPQLDIQVTHVSTSSTWAGDLPKVNIEGILMRERDMANSVSYPSNGIGYATFSGTIPPYQSVTIQPNQAVKQMKFVKDDKGMTVDINTIETVDGIKAQIVLHAGSKKVIAWESEAFEDDEDLSAKGAQTGDVKAKKAAEGHAKSVLKALFSQS